VVLRTLVQCDLDVTDVSDAGGTVRVRLTMPTCEDCLRTAIADRMPAATPFTMVLERVRGLLTHADRADARLLSRADPGAARGG
jgi:hypothetical protein